MRSSVSVILSSPPPDTSMSYPDYGTHPHHHQTLLVVVRQVGSQLKSRSFHKLYERICRVNNVKVSDSNGAQRSVWVTYCRDYPVENNDWGDFQTHRRLLGLITLGQVEGQRDLNEICKQHESLKVKYSSTLYDSRCIILGLNPDGTIYESGEPSRPQSRTSSPDPSSEDAPTPAPSSPFRSAHQKSSSNVSADRDSGVYETIFCDERGAGAALALQHDCASQGGGTSPELTNHVNGSGASDSGSESTSDGLCAEDDSPERCNHLESAHDTSHSSLSTNGSSRSSSKICLQHPLSFKSRAFFYPTTEHAVNLEAQVREFVSALFWILESKRLDKSQEKLEKPPLLCAPFERKDFVGLDMDSRTNRKRCVGRLRKQLADLCLQVGLPNEAVVHYTHAADILRNCNDWLWLAACFEGLCAASVIILYPHLRKGLGLQRFSSLGVGGSGGIPGSVNNRVSANKGISTNSLPTGLDPSVYKQQNKYCLNPDDIFDKYREAIIHYSKYRNAGVVETEASIKAVHVLIEQRQYLLAAEFLSNVVFINLQLSDEEKIARFNALSELYHQIGFHRKASFFRRVAAMRCAAPQNPNHNWSQCYQLLLHTLDGYKISLDPISFQKGGTKGWPALQIQILQELVGTSRRMGQHSLCTRHQAFLLSTMLPHLSVSERQEMAAMLESLSSKSACGTSPIAVQDSGIIIPPVSFINIPVCICVRLMIPPHDRRAEKKASLVEDKDCGPFIFSPFPSMTVDKVPGKMDFVWVEGDVCEVSLELENPMPFELKVSSMMLLTEGITFESWTSTVVLPADSGPQTVTLRGRPQRSGELKICGYSSSILGVSSNCRFKYMPQFKIPQYTITVVPPLPHIQIFSEDTTCGTGLMNEKDEESLISLCLLAGETRECSIVLHNMSSLNIEEIEVTLDSSLEKSVASSVFQFSQENIKAQLPIPPGGKASLTLCIYGHTDFLCPGKLLDETLDSSSFISGSEPPSLVSVGFPSVFSGASGPSRQSFMTSSTKGNRTKRSESTTSQVSSKSGSSTKSSTSSSLTQQNSCSSKTKGGFSSLVNPETKTLHGQLKICYSGSPGNDSGYCRMSYVSIDVTVVPSLLVTRWDVLPAELPHLCYIVLDLLNITTQEMDLQYTSHKHILVEAGDSCRIPVPIDRCPLKKVTQGEDMGVILGNHVAMLVDLQWVLGPDEVPGRALLKGITFPSSAHDLITMSPIQWDICVNGCDVTRSIENAAVVGETVSISMTVSNASGDLLPSLVLRLVAFQDNQNGQLNYALQTKMATIGSSKITLPQMATDEKYCHTCGLIFFTPGLYKIEISCSPASEHSISSLYENVTPPFQHLWKFTPPLEILIRED